MFWKVGPGRVDGRGLGYVQLGLQDSFLTTFSEQIICKKKLRMSKPCRKGRTLVPLFMW